MNQEDFYKALDAIIPGGALEELDLTVVSNRNLYLTRISMEGLQDMHEYSIDDRLYKYLEFEPFKNIDETKAYLQKLIDRMGTNVQGRKCMYWFIRTRDTHKIIGSIGLVDIDFFKGSAAWGYAISPDYWGRGHILEAQLLIVSYFFDTLKMNRLWGITIIDNEATISSVLSAGFQQEGVLRDYYRRADGQRKDGFIYSLLAKDYQSQKDKKLNSEKLNILTLDQLKKLFSTAFGIPESKVDLGTTIMNLAEWDSLNHVILISLIEKQAAFKFKPAQIAGATSVKAILDIVNNQGKR